MSNSIREALKLAVEKLPSSVRMRARNAFDGFDRARKLLPIDREMASFRAITAEEEAVSALFLSLQQRNYPGSERLRIYSHPQKAAVAPFLAAVKLSLVGGRGKINIQLTIDVNEPSLEVRLPLAELGVSFPGSETKCLQLVEPLGLLGAAEDGANPTDFFNKNIAKVASATNVGSIQTFVRNEANVRNTLLYASDHALPQSKATDATIEFRQKRADTALLLAIAVLQVKTHQVMALQCLAAFLKMIGKALEVDPIYPTVEPDIIIKPS